MISPKKQLGNSYLIGQTTLDRFYIQNKENIVNEMYP